MTRSLSPFRSSTLLAALGMLGACAVTPPSGRSMPADAMAAVQMPAAASGVLATSRPFAGVKANRGSVSFLRRDGRDMLQLSGDFVVPDAPAPHWQLVDAQGQTFLLQRLTIKDGRINDSIVVPEQVHEIAKVQIWCAFAETLLGETGFEQVVVLRPRPSLARPFHASTPFAGVKADRGLVTHGRQDGVSVLTLSDEFVVPDTPAPHWQIVDGRGRTYLLQRLVAKDGKYNRTITVPAYVTGIAKVQIWCAFAETLLGEASFDHPVQ